MTAIVGFNCVEGAVIAADTEESYEPDKAYANKIFPFTGKEYNLCIAGAGIGYLVDFAKDKIVAAAKTCRKNVTAFESQLGVTLK